MSVQPQSDLADFVVSQSAALARDCTRCGRCVEVCPVVPYAGLGRADPAATVGGILGVLMGGGELNGAAGDWAQQCNGCGACIPACPEGINPRQMLMLALTLDARHESATPALFRKMARAIRLMAAMQLVPEDMDRLLRPASPRAAEVVFYLGCNAVRTPHVLFNAMYVLDALGVDYAVSGGPASCCGIIHAKWEGELERGGRITEGTLEHFADMRPDKVLSWCPSCQLHIGETIAGYREVAFDFDHVTSYLVEQADRLRALYTTPVPLRVLLHAHDGMRELGDNVTRLLRDVPGLTVVDVAWESGYTCGGSGADRSPGLKAEQRAETLRRAGGEGIDALVTLYHGCHRQLAADGAAKGLRVVNFTELLVEGLGGSPREDALEALRSLGDWHAIAEAAMPSLDANGMAMDADALAGLLPEVFAMAEFNGGLQQFAERTG